MRIGIIDADLLDNGTRHPNLALMKLSGYYKQKGETVELLEDYESLKEYEIVHVSKVFNFTKVPEFIKNESNVILGGTGFFEDGGELLHDDIEHHMPDYSLYDQFIEKQIALGKKPGKYNDYKNYSIGFTSRGCFRKCEFCVNKKYDKALKHSPIEEFIDNDKPYIYLWDDNFLAFSGWEEVLDELESIGKPFQFRQGLDIRLMTQEKAKRLSNVKYHGDFIFAFDHIEDSELIEKKLQLWKRYSTKTTKLYVLCAYESQDVYDIINTFKRIKILMKYGCLPYIMRYEDYNDSDYKSLYIQLARWCNQPNFFKKKSFRQFCEFNQEYHKNPDTLCAAYQAMIDFELIHPDVATEFFDLRFDELNEYDNAFGYGRKYAHKNDCEVCHIDQKQWIDAYHGVIEEDTVLKNYFMQEMDLQCLVYTTGQCGEVMSSDIAEWFLKLLNRTPIEHILKLIENEKYQKILPSNIPQFSRFDDAIFKTIEILENMNERITYDQLGYYLKGKSKKIGAKKKYGENHSKLATLLDLVSIVNPNNVNMIGTSVFGKAYYKLCSNEKESIVSKLLFRIPIVQHVMKDATSGTIDIINYMEILSEKTMNRRRTNVAELFQYIINNSSGELDIIFSNIEGV